MDQRSSLPRIGGHTRCRGRAVPVSVVNISNPDGARTQASLPGVTVRSESLSTLGNFASIPSPCAPQIPSWANSMKTEKRLLSTLDIGSHRNAPLEGRGAFYRTPLEAVVRQIYP